MKRLTILLTIAAILAAVRAAQTQPVVTPTPTPTDTATVSAPAPAQAAPAPAATSTVPPQGYRQCRVINMSYVCEWLGIPPTIAAPTAPATPASYP